jgi:hypothetical protein
VPDQAYRYVLVAFVFRALSFGTMLRLASRGAESSTVWLELVFGLANLVALDWVAVLLYREFRRLRDAASR